MSDFQSMPSIITIAINKSKRQRDCPHNHNRDMSSYAERLVDARESAGMTQTELARAAGLKNQSIIGSLETSYRKSSSYTPAIANAKGYNYPSSVRPGRFRMPVMRRSGRKGVILHLLN